MGVLLALLIYTLTVYMPKHAEGVLRRAYYYYSGGDMYYDAAATAAAMAASAGVASPTEVTQEIVVDMAAKLLVDQIMGSIGKAAAAEGLSA